MKPIAALVVTTGLITATGMARTTQPGLLDQASGRALTTRPVRWAAFSQPARLYPSAEAECKAEYQATVELDRVQCSRAIADCYKRHGMVREGYTPNRPDVEGFTACRIAAAEEYQAALKVAVSRYKRCVAAARAETQAAQ